MPHRPFVVGFSLMPSTDTHLLVLVGSEHDTPGVERLAMRMPSTRVRMSGRIGHQLICRPSDRK